MTSHWFFWLFISLYIIHEGWEAYLTLLNISHTRKNQNQIPDFYKDKVSPEEYEKSIRYTVEKARFGLVLSIVTIPVLWAAILSGFFDYFDFWIGSILKVNGLTHSVFYCLGIALILMILRIPVSIYSHFVIEEKYGFNKMTTKIFIVDFIKGLLLGAALGIPLLCLIFWIYHKVGSVWWLVAFGVVFLFELFMVAIYPTFIAPIFNKFTPLADGELKESILSIAKRVRFKLSGIYTMDGSKRSAHSNAYFAGIGRMRRIVLFDTLFDRHTNLEILAILAHEMGHNIKRHVQKNLLISFFFSLIGFWILSLVITWEPFFSTFGAGIPAPHKALVLFALFSGYFVFLLNPLMNGLSRQHEYEADRFSVETTGDKEGMSSSLIKLSKENLSNLTPHPLYSFYHYSHPTTLERVKAIDAL